MLIEKDISITKDEVKESHELHSQQCDLHSVPRHDVNVYFTCHASKLKMNFLEGPKMNSRSKIPTHVGGWGCFRGDSHACVLACTGKLGFTPTGQTSVFRPDLTGWRPGFTLTRAPGHLTRPHRPHPVTFSHKSTRSNGHLLQLIISHLRPFIQSSEHDKTNCWYDLCSSLGGVYRPVSTRVAMWYAYVKNIG